MGNIGGNKIYGIKATELFPIKDESSSSSSSSSSTTAEGGGGDRGGGGGGGTLAQIWSLVQSKLNPTPQETAEVGLFIHPPTTYP